MIIYSIYNKLNRKSYIGQTVRPLNLRLKEHFRSDSIVGRAIRKYGINSFKISILKTLSSIEELNKFEEYYIKKLNTLYPYGYNLDMGGKNKTMCQSSRKKISLSKKSNLNLDIFCSINQLKNKFRLRVCISAATRVHLGYFKKFSHAVSYYKYCKQIDKWEPVKYPRIDKQGSGYRLRCNLNNKRKYMGMFKTKQSALTHFYKEIYGHNLFHES